MNEIWKEIEGYEGLYEVSNQGRVRSLDRWAKNSASGSVRLSKGRVLKSHTISNGYHHVILYKEGEKKDKMIHRLVAEAFIPNPDNKPKIDHINTDKTDNRVENLRWCTQKENCNNPISLEKISQPVAQYTLDGELIAVYPSVIEASRQTGGNNVSIHKCCNGGYFDKSRGKWVNWTKYKGYVWKYFDE